MSSQSGGCCGGSRRERTETGQPKVTSQPRKAGTEPDVADSSQRDETGKGGAAVTGASPAPRTFAPDRVVGRASAPIDFSDPTGVENMKRSSVASGMDVEAPRETSQHFEMSLALKRSCEEVFEQLDNFAHFGEHMMKSSWMMAGSAMHYEFDEWQGRAQGAVVRLVGSILGLRLLIEERVVERTPPYRKSWETVGNPRMLILKGYRMGFDLTPQGDGSQLRVFIDYATPDSGHGRLLGALFASTYAHWCVKSVIDGAVSRWG